MHSMAFSNRPGARFRRYGRLTTYFVLAAWGIGTSAAGFAQTPALIEGDIWHKADVARATFRRADGSLVDGSGVKVCVMSDSIDNSVGSLAAARRLTPPAVPASIDMPAGQGTGNGEGLAMLEVVHKIAPGAALGFAPMRGTPSENKQTIEALVSAGCKIIVDDNTDERDPPFQDGVVAQAINAATTNGVLFVSSAGNFGNFQYGTAGVWEGDFKDGGTMVAFGPTRRVHAFADGKTYLQLRAPTQAIWLYWDDPFYSPSSVYTLWIYTARTGGFLPYGVQTNGVGQALQFIDARLINNTNTRNLSCVAGSTEPANNCFQTGDIIMVTKDNMTGTTTPSPPRFLRMYTGTGVLDLGTNGATFGHNAAEDVISVGAAEPPLPDTKFSSNSKVEPGSSDGPRRIFYHPDGSAITRDNLLAATNGGRVLFKPDLIAANRVTTTLPANVSSGPELNPFIGTSAAAPHVAGIAALVWSYKPTLTLTQVRLAVLGSAIDIEKGFKPGWDPTSGHGIPMADWALQVADSVTQPLPAQVQARLASLTTGNSVRATAYSPQGGTLVLLDNNSTVGGAPGGVGILNWFGLAGTPRLTWGATPNNFPFRTSDDHRPLPIIDPVAVGFLNGKALVLSRDGGMVSWDAPLLTQQMDEELRSCHSDDC
jgi:subtilisin family serine protease